MTVREAINRGLNIFAIANLAILATSIIHGLLVAPDWAARLDDIAFGAIAVLAVGWYLWGRHRYQRSLAPLVFLVLGLVTKLIGMWVAYGTIVFGGPDFAIAAYLLLTIIVFAWQRYATREPLPTSGSRRATEAARK